MKNLSLLFASLIFLAQSLSAAGFDYRIEGTVPDSIPDGTPMVLCKSFEITPIDSATVKGGLYSFNSKSDSILIATIGWKEPIENGIRTNYIANVVIDSVPVVIKDSEIIAGSALNHKLAEVDSINMRGSYEYRAYYKSLLHIPSMTKEELNKLSRNK